MSLERDMRVSETNPMTVSIDLHISIIEFPYSCMVHGWYDKMNAPKPSVSGMLDSTMREVRLQMSMCALVH